MKSVSRYLFVTLSFILFCTALIGQPYRQTIQVQVPKILQFIEIGNGPEAYYEVYLTNFSSDTFTLKETSILNNLDASLLLRLSGQGLHERLRRPGLPAKDTSPQLLPGGTAMIYVELRLPKRDVKNIVHHFELEVLHNGTLESLSVHTAPVPCNTLKPAVLGPPLKEGIWTAVYHPSWERGHRRVVYTVNGNARIPGRYAIDFIRVDSSGRYARASENIIENWSGYGADVIAVADGVVASTRDNFSESSTLSAHPRYAPGDATGNYISLQVGKNRYAFYEHLKPGSIRVKKGQRVKKGDVLASLGFTGQTTGPHLHFHLADADSPLGGEGLPFVFEHFRFLGAYEDFSGFGKKAWNIRSAAVRPDRYSERPQPNAVILFVNR